MIYKCIKQCQKFPSLRFLCLRSVHSLRSYVRHPFRFISSSYISFRSTPFRSLLHSIHFTHLSTARKSSSFIRSTTSNALMSFRIRPDFPTPLPAFIGAGCSMTSHSGGFTHSIATLAFARALPTRNGIIVSNP